MRQGIVPTSLTRYKRFVMHRPICHAQIAGAALDIAPLGGVKGLNAAAVTLKEDIALSVVYRQYKNKIEMANAVVMLIQSRFGQNTGDVIQRNLESVEKTEHRFKPAL